METVIHIEITPDPDAKLTPLELLEDFADASRGWHYLEEESDHYAQLKNRPACILRHRLQAEPSYVDFGFAATNPSNPKDIELVILDTPTPERRLNLEERNIVIDNFITHFRQYLGGRPGHASLRVEKDEINPSEIKVKTKV